MSEGGEYATTTSTSSSCSEVCVRRVRAQLKRDHLVTKVKVKLKNLARK